MGNNKTTHARIFVKTADIIKKDFDGRYQSDVIQEAVSTLAKVKKINEKLWGKMTIKKYEKIK